MQKRLPLLSIFPEVRKLYRELDGLIKQTGINPLYLEMIKVRASQLNGCAYCLDMHITDALKFGENARRLHVLSAWHEVPEWFSEEEQVILRLTEEITRIGEHGISDEVYDSGISLFGEEKLGAIIMAAISINSWNRIGVGVHLQPPAL